MVRIPIKRDSFRKIKSLGVPIGDIIDIGVLSNTEELVREFRDHKHYLFEPVEEWEPEIRKNYGNARVDYELFQLAVSDKSGSSKLEVWSQRPNRTVTHANLVDTPREGVEVRHVKTETLDKLLQEGVFRKPPYLLKIDVDGAEELVLNGAQKLLDECSVVVIEVHPSDLFDRSKLLLSKGFYIFDIVDLCYRDGFMVQFDIVMLNKAVIEKYAPAIDLRPAGHAPWEAYQPELREITP